MTISAQDLYNYTKCAHRVYLDAHGNPAERSEVSIFVRLLWEMGLQTEKEYLESLGQLPYQDLTALSMEEACRQTIALMQQGSELIYQGGICTANWVGRPDLLVKRSNSHSTFGNYYYEPIDIKAGKGWELHEGKRTHFKLHYAYQVLFYREILKQIQCFVPAVAHIINVDKEIEEFDPAAFDADFHRALQEVERLAAGVETSEPVLGSACHMCHWYGKCRRWVEGTRDPSGLFQVGKVKFELKKRGLRTIFDIAKIDEAQIDELAKEIPHVGVKTLRHMRERAKVRLAGEPLLKPGYRFPEAQREIYFDIEDDPTQGFTYLFGMVEMEQGHDLGYRYFLARSPEDEKHTVRQFWQYLEQNTDAVYYVYSAKERSTLRNLMQRYELEPAIFEHYVAHEYDLYGKLVLRYTEWPSYSYGIKQIAQLLGFKWRDPDPGGANSIAWYNDFLEHSERQDILQRILEYNEDDCRAMIILKQYCEAHHKELTEHG
jgi:predicted RecB family nuclease